MNLTDKPRIYVSSTIFDFHDLRSALKFYFEQLGFEVMLSEANDFKKPLDDNSYHACIKAIESCQYYILLIGSRAGGWFSEVDNVTITRMEYRHAYGLLKQNKIRLISFVRRSLWDIREDRKALEIFLKEEEHTATEATHARIKSVTHHPSKFMNNATATFNFLDEVVRREEMRNAVAAGTNFPIGNWIHPFETFSDIIDVIRTEFVIYRDIRRVAMEVNLKSEVLENAASLLWKFKKKTIVPYIFESLDARRYLKGSDKDSSTLPPEAAESLRGFVLIGLNRFTKLSTTFLDEALSSGLFLAYSKDTSSYVEDELLQLLRRLRREIGLLQRREQMIVRDEASNLYATLKNNKSIGRSITIPNSVLAIPMCISDSQFNILSLCQAILAKLNGQHISLKDLNLYKTSPFEGVDIESEMPTPAETENYLRDYQIVKPESSPPA